MYKNDYCEVFVIPIKYFVGLLGNKAFDQISNLLKFPNLSAHQNHPLVLLAAISDTWGISWPYCSRDLAMSSILNANNVSSSHENFNYCYINSSIFYYTLS